MTMPKYGGFLRYIGPFPSPLLAPFVLPGSVRGGPASSWFYSIFQPKVARQSSGLTRRNSAKDQHFVGVFVGSVSARPSWDRHDADTYPDHFRQAGGQAVQPPRSQGLHLTVQPNGSKLWRISFRYLGKQKTLPIGPWPEISLADARVRREGARKALAAQDIYIKPDSRTTEAYRFSILSIDNKVRQTY